MAETSISYTTINCNCGNTFLIIQIAGGSTYVVPVDSEEHARRIRRDLHDGLVAKAGEPLKSEKPGATNV